MSYPTRHVTGRQSPALRRPNPVDVHLEAAAEAIERSQFEETTHPEQLSHLLESIAHSLLVLATASSGRSL